LERVIDPWIKVARIKYKDPSELANHIRRLAEIAVLTGMLSSVVNLSPPGVLNLNTGWENMMNKQKYMVLTMATNIWAKSPFV
jgi:hypothetical protein